MVERYRSEEGNVPYLNSEMGGDDSVLLLAPSIMESVHRRHTAIDENKSWRLCETSVLGLLYELAKDWKMTELFSFR